jgi:hypothetical protein
MPPSLLTRLISLTAALVAAVAFLTPAEAHVNPRPGFEADANIRNDATANIRPKADSSPPNEPTPVSTLTLN